MKIGDKVILKKHYQHESEMADWGVSVNLPLNVPLIVEGFSSTGKCINFKGYRPNHPPEKFIPYTETKTENKMENCKIHVPTEILSKLVQEKIFSKGITWADSETTVKTGIGEWLLVENGRMYYNPYDDDESPIVSAKKLLGDFDWCLNYRGLSAKQQQQYCKFRGYAFPAIGFQYYGWKGYWDCNNYSWGTELDWESFVHLYLDVKEAIPQTEEEEEHSQIEQKTNMKFKVGDEIEFITEDKYVPSYSTSRKLDPYIKHGSTIFQENKGIINAIVDEYYMVEYTDERDKKVQLGFKEDVLKLKTQTKIKTQYLTRDQLIILLNKFECSTWKNEIKKLLTGHEFSVGDTKINITASISKLISEGTPSQKSAVQNLGVILVEDKSVVIPEFSALYSRASKLIELRNSGNPDFDKKSFYLGTNFNWEIKNDGGCLCLVPTKK